MLFVELRNPTNIEAGPLYLVFEQVEYFSGLTIWKGANFAVAPDEECFKLLKLCGYGEIATLEQIREHVPFRLYTVPGTEPQVQILSAKAYWTDNYDEL